MTRKNSKEAVFLLFPVQGLKNRRTDVQSSLKVKLCESEVNPSTNSYGKPKRKANVRTT